MIIRGTEFWEKEKKNILSNQDTMSLQDTANKYGVSKQLICEKLKKWGINKRPKKFTVVTCDKCGNKIKLKSSKGRIINK